MQVYETQAKKLSGSSYKEVERAARKLHRQIAAQSKRSPYIRSKYFNKEKVFINLFWEHLNQKRQRDRKRRLKFYPCAIELIKETRFDPTIKGNPNRYNELQYRFIGLSYEGQLFCVQIKEMKKTGQKHLISVFPLN